MDNDYWNPNDFHTCVYKCLSLLFVVVHVVLQILQTDGEILRNCKKSYHLKQQQQKKFTRFTRAAEGKEWKICLKIQKERCFT